MFTGSKNPAALIVVTTGLILSLGILIVDYRTWPGTERTEPLASEAPIASQSSEPKSEEVTSVAAPAKAAPLPVTRISAATLKLMQRSEELTQADLEQPVAAAQEVIEVQQPEKEILVDTVGAEPTESPVVATPSLAIPTPPADFGR